MFLTTTWAYSFDSGNAADIFEYIVVLSISRNIKYKMIMATSPNTDTDVLEIEVKTFLTCPTQSMFKSVITEGNSLSVTLKALLSFVDI